MKKFDWRIAGPESSVPTRESIEEAGRRPWFRLTSLEPGWDARPVLEVHSPRCLLFRGCGCNCGIRIHVAPEK